MNILVIDDNKEITEMISKYLILKENQCTVSNGGANGLSLILNNQFDGILLDLAMPEISGFDVLEALEKNDKLLSNTILILTAVPLTGKDESLLKKFGVKEILKKPVELANLIKLLEKYSQK